MAASTPSAVITVGSRVTLAPGYQDVGDAGSGPLKPGDIGVVVTDDRSGCPYNIRAETGASVGKSWWYRAAAVKLADGPTPAGAAPAAAAAAAAVAVAAAGGGGPFVVNGRVRIRAVPVDEAVELQRGHGGWSPDMAGMLGSIGVIKKIESE